MAIGNFVPCLTITLKHEGGWSDHPADPGGATMKGVTIGRYRQYYPNATKTDLRNISQFDLERIYRDDYWRKVAGDELPHGVDLATFDYGVNSGPSRGVRYLQSVLGVKQDGVAGHATIAAANLADGKDTIKRLCAARISFVRGLRTFSVFGKGWSRRIADIEARAVAMWMTKGAPLSEKDRKAMRAESDKASSAAKKQSSGAGAAGGAGAGSGAMASGGEWWIIAGVVIVGLLLAGYLAWRARHNKNRSDAYWQASIS